MGYYRIDLGCSTSTWYQNASTITSSHRSSPRRNRMDYRRVSSEIAIIGSVVTSNIEGVMYETLPLGCFRNTQSNPDRS